MTSDETGKVEDKITSIEAKRQERIAEAERRLDAILKEVRARAAAIHESGGEVDPLGGDPIDVIDALAAEPIPDIGASISRIRARLRKRINDGSPGPEPADD